MSAPRRRSRNPLLWLLLPLVVLAGILAMLLFARPLDELTASAPPVETARASKRRGSRPA